MAAGESCPEDGWGAKRKKQGTGKAQRSGQVSGRGWGYGVFGSENQREMKGREFLTLFIL